MSWFCRIFGHKPPDAMTLRFWKHHNGYLTMTPDGLQYEDMRLEGKLRHEMFTLRCRRCPHEIARVSVTTEAIDDWQVMPPKGGTGVPKKEVSA